VAISNTSFESSNIAQTPLITGFALETTQTTTNSKLDTLNTTLTDKVLNKTTSSIDISGQTVAISNTAFESSNIAQTPLITGFALETTQTTTNSKLDTLNTTLTNKHLDKTTDSVDITNQNINVNQTVEGSSYDLIEQGSTLWADSLPTPNPFVADLLGREGWWYSNQGNVANKSNIYWYANPPTGDPSGFQENDMTFSQLSTMYSVITCDFVDNGSLTIPTMGIYSQPTGTNDIAPGFAHSRWVYQLSSADRAKLRKGETILIYTGATRPEVFNELPAYPLVQVSVIGEAQPSEIIGYMTVNTQATTSTIAYLLQYVGYLNSAVGHIKQYGFKNSKQRLAQSNLASLTVVDGVLSVSSSGGGGGGGGVVQGISTTSGVAVDINASPSGEGINRLLVSSFIDDGTNNLSINNDGSITAISLVTAKDADSAGDNMDIFARANRLFTDTEITGGGNTLVVNEDGSINVAGSGSDGKAYLYSGNEASAITATVVDTKTGIDANIVNVSLDTHCYGSSDGTTFHHLKTTANGNLITESKTHDGSNNPITSSVVDTKRGLDVNIIAGGGGGGNVTVDNIADTPLITGFSLETGGNLDAIKANTDKNLYDVDGNLKVNVVVGGGGGGGGGGVVQLQAYSSADGTTPVNVYATDNRLLTNTLSGEPIVGSLNNIHSGNLSGATFSTALNINNNYGNESVISYKDTSSAVTSFITIWGAFDNTSDASYFYIGVLQPVVIRTGNRYASAVLKLKGLKFIRIYNENANTVGGVSCSLFSG
jgi:hypothetical protein